MEYYISLLALLLTFYQLRLQRVHNEKSLMPLGQINFREREYELGVSIQNNGVGPLIIEKLTFTKNGKEYPNIQSCLELDPKSYFHISVDDLTKKVVLPGTSLEVFFMSFEGVVEKDKVSKMLSVISIKANCKDIYNNKSTIERDFKWFIRHANSK